jgi:hypothetical protein
MEFTNLKSIFPHSFIDYDGMRKARVVIHGRHKASEVAEKIDKGLDFGQSVAVEQFGYSPKQGLSHFTLQASGPTPPFLPTFDVAEIEEIKKEKIKEKEDDYKPKEDTFSDNWNSFLNL